MMKTFAYHQPTKEGLRRITVLREDFSKMLARLNTLAPESREKALAQTKLEEAAMWAIKAIVINDEGSIADMPGERADGLLVQQWSETGEAQADVTPEDVAGVVQELAHTDTLPMPEELPAA